MPSPASPASLTIREFSIGRRGRTPAGFDEETWDAFVAGHPDGTAFHRTAWLHAVADALGHSTWALEARDGSGQLRGVLPLIQVRSSLFGNFVVATPFASYGGPLGDADAVHALVHHAVTIARRVGAGLLELRGRRPVVAGIEAFQVSTRKITVTLSLEGGADAVFGRFPAKLRSQIRRSEREGVSVHVAPGQVEAFHAVYSEHMRDLGTPALPRRFFDALAARFGTDMMFAIARLDGIPIACGAGFRYGAEFEITWASALRAYNRMSPNMALYWQFMAHLADSGAAIFNFGRCSVDSGTHRFKRQWGGVDEPLPWYQWQADDTAPVATPSPGGGFSLAQAAWMRLPLPLARTMGPWIARLLP